MDHPLFLNLALPQQPQQTATSAPPVTSQVNGLPQESKLATYISVSLLMKIQSVQNQE